MNSAQATVLIVDDDPSVLSSLRRLLRTTPYATMTFEAGRELLECDRPAGPACAVVDLHLPDIDGLELPKRLAQRRFELPIIFLTGYGSVDAAVGAMKDGAVDFLSKPVDLTRLLSALERAISRDVAYLANLRRVAEATRRVDSLTEREREVLKFVITGRLNKQIADEMEIREKTVKVHRGKVMEKMRVKSVADLVRLAAIGGITGEQESLWDAPARIA
jgi:FixJ family two-component response regulator